jgi:peptidoglycan/LPS O-acetylase OafA/YrhL
MFSLNRSKNDTSVTLDLLRATAAQMVCVGHAINYSGLSRTLAPDVGVLIFFILSGFVIAHTLKSKTEAGPYSLGRYGVERFCRIYVAYLPAMVLIGAAHVLAAQLGLEFSNIGSAELSTFVANLFMLQMYPMNGSFGSFGSAGQLGTIAQEFHIYFFVGGLYFLCIGRQRFIAAGVAVLSAAMPLGNFLTDYGRSLFILWLMGFAVYFVVRSIKIDRMFAALFAVTAAGILYQGFQFLDFKSVYNVANFPAVALGFAAITIATQCYRALAANRIALGLIHFFASYSLTLFLLHLTVIRVMYAAWPHPSWLEVSIAIVLSNLLAAGLAFSRFGEIQYKRAAEWIMGQLRLPTVEAPAE